jgi:aspartate/methionine/tyrosine aminotransferase
MEKNRVPELSIRGQGLIASPSPIMLAHQACAQNPFHAEKNPKGHINFGTAENFLMQDENEEIIKRTSIRGEFTHYQPFEGMAHTREILAQFFQEALNIPARPEELALASGTSALLEMLSFALLDAGDEIIIPAPYYTGFVYDFTGRFGGKIVAAPLFKNLIQNESALELSLDFEALEKTIAECKRAKVLMLNNPHNPTGYVFSESDILEFIRLAKKYRLEIISDEIYAFSIFNPNKKFISALDQNIQHDYRQHIHVLYGMAKDFGLSGMKVGFLYSENQKLVAAINAQTYFHAVSSIAQEAISLFLQDAKSYRPYFKRYQQKLLANYQLLVQEIEKMGHKLAPRQTDGGIFALVDFSKWLKENTKASEMELFGDLMREQHLNFSPGQFLEVSTPGYFRFCYAAHPVKLAEGLARLKRFNDER